jgi:NAD(P)-dependent dehydrogenase (short-subunit alcohol dehydrogenase family)
MQHRKTVLITGTASGIGLETARYFHQKGWNVIATMRHPNQRTTPLHAIDSIVKLHLDVTDRASIQAALDEALRRFGRLDVVVNNAGYGLAGPLEAVRDVQVRRQFETNVFGLIDVVRAVVPVFRQQQDGVVVNVASMGGRITFPLYSLYHATKWAVEGFSEALQHEVRAFGIRIKIVEPGPIRTDFYDRSVDIARFDDASAYDAYVERVMQHSNGFGERGAPPPAVARQIFRAATDGSARLRYPAGLIAHLVLPLRRLLPDRLFNPLIRAFVQG